MNYFLYPHVTRFYMFHNFSNPCVNWINEQTEFGSNRLCGFFSFDIVGKCCQRREENFNLFIFFAFSVLHILVVIFCFAICTQSHKNDNHTPENIFITKLTLRRYTCTCQANKLTCRKTIITNTYRNNKGRYFILNIHITELGILTHRKNL